jgi:hypothetical protein
MKDVPVEELSNECVPADSQNEIEQNTSEDITEEISCEPMESGTEQANTAATTETEETGPKEKKSRFRFSMFSNEK